MKMQIRKDGLTYARWTVRWRQDGTPRTYWAQSWTEAIGFAFAQIRAMKEAKP